MCARDEGGGMWDVGCGTWDVGCGMWDAGCEMRDDELKTHPDYRIGEKLGRDNGIQELYLGTLMISDSRKDGAREREARLAKRKLASGWYFLQ